MAITRQAIAAAVMRYSASLAPFFQPHATDQQITTNDVCASLLSAYGGIKSLQFAIDENCEDGTTQSIKVRLVGNPNWEAWSYEVMHSENGKISATAGYGDGVVHTLLQDDGCGLILPISIAPTRYLNYCGILLQNIGLGPNNSTDSCWPGAFKDPELELVEDKLRAGVFWERHRQHVRVLDGRYGFMPTRSIVYGKDGSTLGELEFERYRQYDDLWFPELVRKTNSRYRLAILGIEKDKHLDRSEMRAQFPFGTRVYYEGGNSSVFGTSSISDAEAALNNWLLYSNRFGRHASRSGPVEGVQIDSRMQGWQVAVVTVNLAALLLVLMWFRVTRRGVTVALGVLLAARVDAAPPANQPDERYYSLCSDRTDISVAYLLSAFYEKQPSLDEIISFGRSTTGFDLVKRVLESSEIHSTLIAIPFDDMIKWPRPVVFQWRPRLNESRYTYAILLGEKDGYCTLIDPRDGGRLAPIREQAIAERYAGMAMLTSEGYLPVRSERSGLVWASFLFPGIAALLIAIRFKGRRIHLNLLLIAIAIVSFGCKSEIKERESSKQSGGLTIDSLEWNIGDCYQGVVKRETKLSNNSNVPLKVIKIRPSCGCLAVGVPVGRELSPGDSISFGLQIDLLTKTGFFSHSIAFEYSDGASQEMLVSGRIRAGIASTPASLQIEFGKPNEQVSRQVALASDDGADFEIISAAASIAESVLVDNSTKTVNVTLRNANKETISRDTLVIITSHPHRSEVRVPIIASAVLTWEVRPSNFLIRGDSRFPVSKDVTIRSLAAEPFEVFATNLDGISVLPDNGEMSTTHKVTISLATDQGISKPTRVKARIRTSLHDAAVVEVSFLFYD